MDQSVRENFEYHKALWPEFRRTLRRVSLAEEIEILRRFGDIQPSDTVLEVGCGTGRILTGLLPTTANVIGVDMVWDAAAETRSNGVMTVQASGFQLPFKDASIDCVICNDVIHSLPSDLSFHFLHELARVSRDRIILGMIRNRPAFFMDLRSILRSIQKGRLIEGSSINTLFWRFGSVKTTLEKAGLRIIRLQPAARYIASFHKNPWYKKIYRLRPGRIGIFGWLLPEPWCLLQYDMLLSKDKDEKRHEN